MLANMWFSITLGLLIVVGVSLVIVGMMRRREELRAMGREAEKRRFISEDTQKAFWYSDADSSKESSHDHSSSDSSGGESGH